ncbi:hypothetical protein MHA_2778 [Mannheimia haemolytica PHL213]|nr:hypothetical protein MHA_2778 [Mannheimia haemolytica PHL213]
MPQSVPCILFFVSIKMKKAFYRLNFSLILHKYAKYFNIYL